jgi:spermidine dehydrogenase
MTHRRLLPGDEVLGMDAPIARRDFLNATLIAAGGALLCEAASRPPVSREDWAGYGGVGDYRDANGNTRDVMEAAHAIRDRLYEPLPPDVIDTGELFDLVVVGGGLSGLAAAVLFDKKPGRRCLVLDNHSIFGGEAKRNEFVVDGQVLPVHQGSAFFPVPHPGGFIAQFYDMIGMDRPALAYQKWQGPDREIPLSQTPYDMLGEEPATYAWYFGARFGEAGGKWLVDPWGQKLASAPISEAARADLLRYKRSETPAPKPEREGDALSRRLDAMTLEEHLMDRHGIARETVRTFLSPVEGGGYGLGADALSAYCAYAAEVQHPEDGDERAGDQMFPDGNSGFARLMVKTLIPDAIEGPRTVESVCKNRVRFGALDRPGQPTQIRLSATVVRVEHEGEPSRAPRLLVAYARGGRVYLVRARSAILAGGSWTTKHIVRDLPAAHREAYAEFHRSPCVMANVAVRSWRFLYDMGISGCRWFEGLGNYFEIRKLATVGARAKRFGPDSPTVLTLKILYTYPGLPTDVQGSRGRVEMLSTSFGHYERAIRQQLAEMFARAGFEPRRDIAGIVLNRWGHAYLSPPPGFFFGRDGKRAPRDVLRAVPFGRIAFANTDLAGLMDHRSSILEADRAVAQIEQCIGG